MWMSANIVTNVLSMKRLDTIKRFVFLWCTLMLCLSFGVKMAAYWRCLELSVSSLYLAIYKTDYIHHRNIAERSIMLLRLCKTWIKWLLRNYYWGRVEDFRLCTALIVIPHPIFGLFGHVLPLWHSAKSFSRFNIWSAWQCIICI